MSTGYFTIPSPLQEVAHSYLNAKNITLYVKRDDLIHPHISGNKWRKLKWNFESAKQQGHDTILTFGGAHSNHIAATAAASEMFNFRSIGIIRGEDADLQNPTLKFAAANGMRIHRITRSDYKEKTKWEYLAALRNQFGRFYHIPEGGANFFGVQGCQKIMDEINIPFQKIFCACGTGTTLSGMAIANKGETDLYGVSVLKSGGFLLKILEDTVRETFRDKATELSILKKVHLLLTYHFGGYAKTTSELIDFMKKWYDETEIKLDAVYTAKAAYAMLDLARKMQPEQPERWILLHTGGLQGLAATEHKLGSQIYI